MGSVLVVGGWVELESEDASAAWRAKPVAAAKLSGWSAPIDKPASSAFDRLTIGALWTQAAEAPEPIEIVETARGVRFAAAFASVTGRELWAPALFAAVRRAAGAGSGGAWAMLVAEGGSVLSVELAGRGSFQRLDEDDDVERAIAEPELVRAIELVDGAPPPERGLASLAPRTLDRAPTAAAKPTKTTTRKAEEALPPQRPRPAPTTRKLPVRVTNAIVSVAQRPSGELVMVGRFGLLARGRLEDSQWTSRALGLGKLSWIAANGQRLWLCAHDGLFSSDDDGATFVRRGPDGVAWTRLLFVNGVVLGGANGELFRSTDDCTTWTSVLRMEDGLGISQLARGPDDSIVGVGLMGRVVVSRDLGQTFERVNDGPSEAFLAMSIEGDDAWYLSTTRIARARASRPGEYVSAGPKRDRNADYRCIRCRDGTVWVGAEHRVLRSRDRGASWEIVLEKEAVFLDVLPLGPRRAIAVGSDSLAFVIDG